MTTLKENGYGYGYGYGSGYGANAGYFIRATDNPLEAFSTMLGEMTEPELQRWADSLS